MSPTRPVLVEVSVVIVALDAAADPVRAMVLTPPTAAGRDLPTTAFDPDRHRTLQQGLRDWVAASVGIDLGYVEQLYTFGDPIRSRAGPHTVSIGYLALAEPAAVAAHPGWTPWDLWFPWEDRRTHSPPPPPALVAWGAARGAADRVALCFGLGEAWRDELALERYELLYEADLVPESWRDRGLTPPDLPRAGTPAPRDHRRILATAIGRLRAKLKYRPVLFELMGPDFTLYDLQRAAEAVAGISLHKQNFRRMVEGSGLIEPTGAVSTRAGGRPAALYRLAARALSERRAAALRFGAPRRV